MEFDFDRVINRRGSGSEKWNVAPTELPMWVADMDFQTAPAVQRAIAQRAAHGIFGYTGITDDWYTAYQNWWQQRHGFCMERSWLLFCTGVVPAISSVVRKLTSPAEQVVLLTPVYNIFFNCVRNNGRVPLQCPLQRDRNGMYSIDFARLTPLLEDRQTTLLLLCNPHNPVGKIWDRETLATLGRLCRENHVIVLSDEIHCDLTDPGCAYVPFASVSEDCLVNSITCLAPTKAFNLAGLQTAAVCIANETLRHKVWRALNTDEVAEPNAFAVDGAVAAFTQGGPWLDALRKYLYANKCLARSFIAEQIPQLEVSPAQATYLLWLHSDAFGGGGADAAAYIRAQSGLYVCGGNQYGAGGEDFLRMNIACPRSLLQDGLNRLQKGMQAYLRHKQSPQSKTAGDEAV